MIPRLPPVEADNGRIERALDHFVAPVGPGQFRVVTRSASEDKSYSFYVQTRPNLICYCSDAAYRAPVCKHILAALIHDQDLRMAPYQSAVAAARAKRDANDPPHAPAEDAEPYPDALSVNEVLALYEKDPDLGQSRRYAGRVLTDPSADLATLRGVAARCTKLHIRIALLRIPEAAADPILRRALVERDPAPHIIARMLPSASDDDEFRLLFRKLLEAKAIKAARRVIDENRARALATLRPSDLAGFFASDRREDREYGLNLVGRLQSGAEHEAAVPIGRKARKVRKA